MIDYVPPSMVKAVLIFGNWFGGGLLLLGSAVLAQATFDNVERGVVGVTILGVGALVVRWVLKTSERVEQIWSNAVASAEHRADEAERRCGEMTAKYDQERRYRIALEESGMQDRRHPPDADPKSV